ncbi:DUF87 domain-containing protein [Acinetobacter sp. ANC 4635]|uniref:ATP-binding protein n=1 Tax=Acinetobacter sp. ANC 4635 TaxID=2529846 RepID=UPI00103A49F7|nr:DUF87 domain-containing protein [Acinetobacter sp. ANC 4635]TCB28486.1 DUF87 domain-containing protein [Acinetobacter sp. ANC 4635]
MDLVLDKKMVINEYSKSKFDIQAFKEAVFLNQNERLIEFLNLDENFEIDNSNSRFFRITELSAQESFLLRQDLENVIACMKDPNFNWVYFLSGTESGIEIYIGIVLLLDQGDVFHQKKLLESQLLGNISGVLLEDVSSKNLQDDILSPLKNAQHFGLLTGVPSLTVDQQAQSKGLNINQGIDRLARSLVGETWQLLLVAQPAKFNEINQTIEQLLNLSSDLHYSIKKSIQSGTNTGNSITEGSSSSKSHGLTDQTGSNKSRTEQTGKNDSKTTQKSETAGESSSNSNNNSSKSTSESKNKGWTKGESDTNGTSHGTSDSTGTSESRSVSQNDTEGKSFSSSKSEGQSRTESIEVIDKNIERIEKHITEKQLPRFELGRSKGLFKTATYLSAYNKRTYESLVLAVRTIFQGNQSIFSPLQVQKLQIKAKNINQLFKIHWEKTDANKDALLLQSTPIKVNQAAFATWLNASELSILAGLPSREVCGIRLRKNVDFAVNPLNSKESASFELGRIIQNGRILEKSKVLLDKKLLNQHIFISGVTGAGKTTTCQQILLQSKLPFLVIEPAKTEYRGLYELDKDIQFYTLNNEQISPFRINPFELLPNEQLVGHIDTLKATFAAVFPMEASMPYLIEEAVVRSYESKGWDIHTSKNFLFENPFNCQGQAFPIMSEMLEQLKLVIKSKGFGDDLQQKYEGSLISRLDNLTIGSKGRMLNTRISIDVSKMLDQKVVIELDELKDEQDKALMMGLLISRVAEAMKQRHYLQPDFQHVTLIEEAHRLLEKPQGHDDGAKKLGVNLFANLLAEVRKYGEGLIIADQIPNKLAPEVLKNTNTKIIHRLFAADDRQAIGETVGLTEEQINFLPMLKAGEAVVYSAGWHEAVRTQVGQLHNTNSKPLDIQIIASHSQRRIFNQREQLYPRLSKLLSPEITAETFNEFIQEGSFVLNLWLKWYALSQNEEQGRKLIITQRLSGEMEKLNQTWSDPEIDIKLALAQLFLDIAPIAYIEDKLPTKYPAEQYLIFLFGLYEHDKLNEEITSDIVFGQDTGRLITRALQVILQKLNSI